MARWQKPKCMMAFGQRSFSENGEILNFLHGDGARENGADSMRNAAKTPTNCLCSNSTGHQGLANNGDDDFWRNGAVIGSDGIKVPPPLLCL